MASVKPKKAVAASGPPSATSSSVAHPKKRSTAQIQAERFRALIEDVADGFYEVDLRGNFKFFNDALCRIFGYPRCDIQDRNYTDFMDEKSARSAYEAFNRIFRKGGGVADIRWEIIRPDSERRFLEISAKLIGTAGAEGRVSGDRPRYHRPASGQNALRQSEACALELSRPAGGRSSATAPSSTSCRIRFSSSTWTTRSLSEPCV